MPRRERLFWLLLEKGVLAAVLAFAGYYFSDQLKQRELVSKYQEGLFDKRLQAYSSLLSAAEHARNVAVHFYSTDLDSTAKNDPDQSWQSIIGELSRKSSSVPGGGGGGSITWATTDDFLSALRPVVDARRLGSLYLSDGVAAATDSFLVVLTKDLRDDLSRRGARVGRSGWVDHEAGRRANDAYLMLRARVRAALRIEEMILG
jgi:hypothetical protein